MIIKFAICVCNNFSGGEDGNSRIYKCTMAHNRDVCVVLYVEEEYEALVLECNWKSKTNVKAF